MLTSPITDPWGFQWDGLERTAATLDVASTDCETFGGRLPTATELYRVSAPRSGAVGESFHTNYLWTIVPGDRLRQSTLRLSDGTSALQAASSPLAYRCVCAPDQLASFSGTRCNGPAGSECVEVGRYNIDREDRPALRRSSAVWECSNEHAHLAELGQLVEGIHAGVPGSNAFIATADHWSYHESTTLRWQSATGWELASNVGTSGFTTSTPFRCAGTSFVQGTYPATVPNEFAGPHGGYKSETVDSAAGTWTALQDACIAKGGHLPRANELAELIMEGLPNGSNAPLFTSDQTGYNSVDFLAATLKWTALDRRFPYEYIPDGTYTANWNYKTASMPSRCVFYPIDPMWTAPDNATCNGGCFDAAPPVGPSRIVLDSTDRAAVSWSAAVSDCRQLGGHLASERDLTEAIRKGLPNGSSPTFIATSDTGLGNITVVRWTGVEPLFSDLWPTHMTWVGPATVAPYRCMWTNELR